MSRHPTEPGSSEIEETGPTAGGSSSASEAAGGSGEPAGSGEDLEANPVPLGIRLFLIPFLIVVACGLVLLIGRLLSTGDRTAWDYMEEIRTAGGNRRWQAAYELSTLLDRQGMQVPPELGAEMIRLFEESGGQDPRVRRYLAIGLGKIGVSEAVGPLIGALEDPDPDTRLYAVWSLGALGDTTAVGALEQASRDADPGLRTAAAYSLGSLGTRRGLTALSRLLEDPVADVRWNAATGLARQGDTAGLPILAGMIDRESLSVLAATMNQAQQDEIIVNGLRAISRLPGRPLEPEIEELAKVDRSPAVRRQAADVLAARR